MRQLLKCIKYWRFWAHYEDALLYALDFILSDNHGSAYRSYSKQLFCNSC